MIHNVFFIPGKVPSMNDIISTLKMGGGTKGKRQHAPLIRRTNDKGPCHFGAKLYSDIKREWSGKVVNAVNRQPQSVRVDSAFFSYLVVEKKRNRDPSNICSMAVKFIEDGLQKAGVIPGDGWKQVLGISAYWGQYENHEPGVYVVMSDREMNKETVEQVCWRERRMNETV